MEPLDPSMTSEIAEELGWPRRTAYEVLNGFADDGEIRKKKP
ncbi:helix-turn-helix domain-containing protein [Haladaptatus halobius]|nr:helix-turn-helix domain-containing protein [Haladaptatus halobius]